MILSWHWNRSFNIHFRNQTFFVLFLHFYKNFFFEARLVFLFFFHQFFNNCIVLKYIIHHSIFLIRAMNSFQNLIVQLLIVRRFTKNHHKNSRKIDDQLKNLNLIDEYIWLVIVQDVFDFEILILHECFLLRFVLKNQSHNTSWKYAWNIRFRQLFAKI